MDYNFCLGQKHSVVIGEQLLASNMKLFLDLIQQGCKPARGHVERRIALRLWYSFGSNFLSFFVLIVACPTLSYNFTSFSIFSLRATTEQLVERQVL